MAEQSAELISFTPASSLQLGEGGGGGVGEGLGLEPPRPSLRISLTHKSENSESLDNSTILSRKARMDGFNFAFQKMFSVGADM